MIRFCTSLVFLLAIALPNGFACGYSFVGDCSSSISLKINGTLDSFAIAPCPGVLQFDGFALGSLQSLSIAGAKAVTWESCQNNVTGAALYYRVYEQGGIAASWQSFNMQEYYNTLVGPYTTRYRSGNANIDLAAGLTAGKTYVLEIYLAAAVDTIGDDFIPETSIFQNNNGQNYHLTFLYGGASAPPFVVAVTKNIPVKCHGGSTGIAGVSVYGNQAGLFYQWSTGGNNSPILAGIPAGTYSVTVTGSGHTATQTVEITEPMPLTAQFYPVAGPGCGGAPGQATAVPGGGTAPYDYQWDDGQHTATAAFAAGGNHAVTVTDANGCTGAYSVNIPPQPVVQMDVSAEICKGETYVTGGQSFATTGFFSFHLPGSNGACDTMVQLTLDVLNPAAAFVSLPDSALVTCSAPEMNLCAAPVANTFYQWSKDGVPAIASLCLLATAGGNYALSATTSGMAKICSALKTVKVEEHLLPPYLSADGTLEYITHCYEADSAILKLKAHTDAQGAVFTWTRNGGVVSQADTCQIITTELTLPGLSVPNVYIADQYGCKSLTVSPSVTVIQPPLPPFLGVDTRPNFCARLVDVEMTVWGGTGPFTILWGDSLVAPGVSSFPPGQYDVVLTDGDGCTTVYEAKLAELLSASVDNVSIFASNDGAAWVYADGDGPYTYLWSNGSTEPAVSNLSAGDYCVTVTDLQSGCALDTCLTVLVPVADLPGPTLQFSPNPAVAGRWVEVVLPADFAGQDAALDIFDLQGRKIEGVLRRPGGGRLLFQAPEAAPPGIYVVYIHDDSHPSLFGKLLLE